MVGQSAHRDAHHDRHAAVTVTALTPSGPFTLGTPSPALPATLATGATLSVPVTYTPTAPGPAGGSVTVATSGEGTTAIPLTGNGEVDGPSLTSSDPRGQLRRDPTGPTVVLVRVVRQ